MKKLIYVVELMIEGGFEKSSLFYLIGRPKS